MNFTKQLFFIACAFLFTLTSFSQTNATQEEDKLSLNSGSIDNQFEFVIRRSNSWQDYKTVKKTWLYALKAHTLDSLKAVHKDLADTQVVVKNQGKEISDLKLNLSNTQTDLDKTNTEKNNMSLFGLQMSKSSYNVLMWSIIGGLLVLLLFFIYKFNNSNAITRAAKKSLAETEEEFEEHRKTALEREQKVRRQLQDEINKQKKA
ncbi:MULTISPECIES: tRNA (guanine-N1)-methyltransferase [unclassified Algibacter]|uniref:tRNA (guanine-N1)-methyltransferase n=1 Tax=unclassified Algibacter TaxID=2615009 RepID=UPI00131BFA2D|nr:MULTISPECIES: tRNA (guanine-N1)-methyltransferase [unclassified Algibacter]MCL5128517.1 tRNA (guanine-N1)-methyltransferase [Algibacter sp. L4_22]